MNLKLFFMKQAIRTFISFAFCFSFLLASLSQAAEVPAVVELEGHTQTIWSIVFTPDGKKVATAGHEGTVRIWDTDTGEELHKFVQGGDYSATEVAFSPDGKKIATASYDKAAQIWETESGNALYKLEMEGDDAFAMISPDSFSPDGTKIVGYSGRNDTARIWDTESGKELRVLEGDIASFYSIAFSPDGKKVMATGRGGIVRIWDADSGETLHKLEGNQARDFVIAVFSPDGKKMVTASADGLARVWDTESGEELQILEGHEKGYIHSARFSPDGKKMVTASEDNTARVWDAESGEMLLKLEIPDDRSVKVSTLSDFDFAVFFPDGRRILTKGRGLDLAVRIWDAESGEELQKLEYTQPPPWSATGITSVAISPDGKRVVAAGGIGCSIARIWTLE